MDVCAMRLFFHPPICNHVICKLFLWSLSPSRGWKNSHLCLWWVCERRFLAQLEDLSMNRNCETGSSDICSMCIFYTLAVRVSLIGCRWRFSYFPISLEVSGWTAIFYVIDCIFYTYVLLPLLFSATPIPSIFCHCIQQYCVIVLLWYSV